MVVTDDDQIAERARLLKNLAYSRRDKFIHEELGYNYRMTNLQAAVGVAQLRRIDRMLLRNHNLERLYRERLGAVAFVPLIKGPVSNA